MGKSAPTPPPPPDPQKVANAQSAADLRTSIGNAWMGNANEINPYGTVNYTQTGTKLIPSDGTKGSKDMTVPTFLRTVALSPTEQSKFDLQSKTQLGLNQIALDETGRIGDLLGSPVDRNTLTPDWVTSLGNTDYEGARKATEDAIYSRVNPQLDRDRNALESKLVNQGFQRGSEAFNQEMDASNRQANDARMQAVLAGGQEQSRLFDINRGSASFQNQARQAGLQEDLALRNQPINEISGLLSQGQVSMPQFQGFQFNPMPSTPIGQYTYQSADLAQRNYQSQVASNNAAMGGMFGLGSSLLYGLFSDRRLKKNIKDLGVKLRNGLKLYAYQYKGEDVPRVGVMAQEVHAVMPGAVHNRSGFLMVDYGKVLEAA